MRSFRVATLAAIAVTTTIGLVPAAAGSSSPRPVTASAPIAAAPGSAAQPGIYMVWDNGLDPATPYIRGGQIKVEWKDVEPARGSFNWAPLASQLATWASLGKSATVQVNADPQPSWIWNYVADCGSTARGRIPQYWDPAYLIMEQEMITSLRSYLATAPNTERITLVRANPDAIGTEETTVPAGYRCKATPSGHISSVAWSKTVEFTFYQQIMGAWLNTLSPTFHVAVRAKTFTTKTPAPPLSWLTSGSAWMFATASDIDPNTARDNLDALAMKYVRTGQTVAYWEHQKADGVKKNLVSWNYWRLLLELQKGVSYPAVYGNVLRYGQSDPEFAAAFNFVNAYAGFHNSPTTTPGAWVALRQSTGAMAGNFGWFISQVDPDGTSTALDSNNGTNMIGNPSQRYGRFARRIDGGTAKDTMYFQLDPTFRSSIATPTGAVRMHVRYLDQGTGAFRVSYGLSMSSDVNKTNTGDWKDAVIDVPGAAFAGALPSGSDITVQALGTDSTILHMVELVVKSR